MSGRDEADRGTEVRFHHSADFAQVLEAAGCSLLISTYQAGQLVAVGSAEGRPTFSFRGFDRAMGVALADDRLAVAGKSQIWWLRDQAELAPAIEPAGRFDRCWLPRSSSVTGAIHCHEIAWGVGGDGEPELWMVNTLFSCLAGLDPRFSFVPRWRPPFVSALAAQDRCHLNGLAMRDGAPAFVTVFATTDEAGGWRRAGNDAGTVLDIATGEPVTTGLAMPHSPRWHDGQLFVLNSGLGRLERVDLDTGSREGVAAVPGYARGLAFHGGLAFVGLSRIRETAVFGGAPIAAYHDELRCGVGVIDLGTGATVATLSFASGVEEIFDVQVVPGSRCPTLGASPGGGEDVWLLPEQR
ncbi:MAG: TIGR03032 family protein [Nocardioidaceae bacterium]